MHEGTIKEYDSASQNGIITDTASNKEFKFGDGDLVSTEDPSKLVAGQSVWYELESDRDGERATDIVLRKRSKLVEDEGDGY